VVGTLDDVGLGDLCSKKGFPHKGTCQGLFCHFVFAMSNM
jgi:hypothetical protein